MSSRSLFIDSVKIFLAFLVVNLHVESFVTMSPFSFLYYLGWYAVPIFVAITFYFLSADLLAEKVDWDKTKYRLKRLLIPFISWSVVGFILRPELITPKYILRQLLTGTAVNPPLYYLLCVTVIIVTYTLLMKIKKISLVRFHISVIFIILMLESSGVMSDMLHYVPVQINFFTSRLLELYKYASIGILLPLLIERMSNLKKYQSLIPLFTITTILGLTYYQHYFQITDLNYAGFVQFTLVLGIMISIIYHKYIWDQVRPPQWIGYTLGIYCLHSFFIDFAIKHSLVFNHLLLSSTIFIFCLIFSLIIDVASRSKLKLLIS